MTVSVVVPLGHPSESGEEVLLCVPESTVVSLPAGEEAVLHTGVFLTVTNSTLLLLSPDKELQLKGLDISLIGSPLLSKDMGATEVVLLLRNRRTPVDFVQRVLDSILSNAVIGIGPKTPVASLFCAKPILKGMTVNYQQL
jgi:hypothetical protein